MFFKLQKNMVPIEWKKKIILWFRCIVFCFKKNQSLRIFNFSSIHYLFKSSFGSCEFFSTEWTSRTDTFTYICIENSHENSKRCSYIKVKWTYKKITLVGRVIVREGCLWWFKKRQKVFKLCTVNVVVFMDKFVCFFLYIYLCMWVDFSWDSKWWVVVGTSFFSQVYESQPREFQVSWFLLNKFFYFSKNFFKLYFNLSNLYIFYLSSLFFFSRYEKNKDKILFFYFFYLKQKKKRTSFKIHLTFFINYFNSTTHLEYFS